MATKGGLHLWPKDFTTDNYFKVFTNNFIWNGYKNTLIRDIDRNAAVSVRYCAGRISSGEKILSAQDFLDIS